MAASALERSWRSLSFPRGDATVITSVGPRWMHEEGFFSLSPLGRCRRVVVCTSILHAVVTQLKVSAPAQYKFHDSIAHHVFDGQVGLREHANGSGAIGISILREFQNLLSWRILATPWPKNSRLGIPAILT